ncbi:putative core protein [Vaccinia virus]|uniref:Putative core protein n=1 Tax=Vaccinia virus TaxID=10245 RepID=A0A2I6J1E3_VACCV|nr:putative core protein [Vaccinia virus]
MNVRLCSGSRHNGIVSEQGYEFCIFCESVFQKCTKVQKKSNFHVSNKLIHLRNVLGRLVSHQCSGEIIS